MNNNWSRQVTNTYKNKFLLNEQSPWDFEDPDDIERQLRDLPRDVADPTPPSRRRFQPPPPMDRVRPNTSSKPVIPPEKAPPRVAPAPPGLRVEKPTSSSTGNQGPRRAQPNTEPLARIRPGGVVDKSPRKPSTPDSSKWHKGKPKQAWDWLSNTRVGRATGKVVDATFGTGLVPNKAPAGVKDLVGKFGGPLGILLTANEYKAEIEKQLEKSKQQQRTKSNDGTGDAIDLVINPTNLTAGAMIGLGAAGGAGAGALGLGAGGAAAGAAAGAGMMAAGVLPAVVGVGGLALGGLVGREMLDTASDIKSKLTSLKIDKDIVDNLKKTPGVDRVALEKAEASLKAREKEMIPNPFNPLNQWDNAALAYDAASTFAGNLFGAATADNRSGEELASEQDELAKKGLQQSGGKVVAAPGRKTREEMKAEEDRVAKEALAKASKRTPEQVKADTDKAMREAARQRLLDQQQMQRDLEEYERNAKR
jgi:hypothetical protein